MILALMTFNNLWGAEEFRIQELKSGNLLFESAIAVQRKLDTTLTLNSFSKLNSQGVPGKNLLDSVCGRVFQSATLCSTHALSPAFDEALATIGLDHVCLEKFWERLYPGASMLLILYDDHLAPSMRNLALRHDSTFVQFSLNDTTSDEFERMVQDKILKIITHKK